MAATFQSILDEARLELNDLTPNLNQVQVHTTGVVTFVYDLQNIQAGTRFSSGLQTFYVWAVSAGNRTAQVSVIQGNTTALLPAGSLVYVNPRYSAYELMVASNSTLRSLSAPASGLYQVKSLEMSYSAARDGYDLGSNTDVQDIYEVLMAQPGPYKNWPRMKSGHYRLNRSADTTDFPSGFSITLFVAMTDNYPFRVTYKAAFGQFATLADTTATVGLPDSCADIVGLGAAIRLMSGAEIARNDTTVQDNNRRMNEVPAGAVQNSVSGLRALYQTRLAEEAGRLAAAWPAYKAE